MDVKRDNDDATIASRQTRGSTRCCHQYPPPPPQRGIKGQGCAEEDLDHLHHSNCGWQQQWLATAVDGGGNGLMVGGDENGTKTSHPWLL
jgi:hypothetical protein